MAAKISKIVIEIGEHEHTVSLEQARELREALNSLLGTPERIVIERERPLWPWYPPYRPTWTLKTYGAHGTAAGHEHTATRTWNTLKA